MSFSNLPPQAYTRDVLAAAYEWLRTQPQSVRELATSSDNLVSLFMQSRRRPGSLNQFSSNDSAAAAPTNSAMNTASAEAFKKDLKSLAEGLKQFEGAEVSSSTTAPVKVNSGNSQVLPQSPPSQTSPTPYPTIMSPPHHAPISQPQTSPQPAQTPQMALSLDGRSLETLRLVQNLLNLSSEREALRMLIVLGYEKIKDFLPKS